MLGRIVVALLALTLASCATTSGANRSETARLLGKLSGCGLDTRDGKVRHDPPQALLTMTAPQSLTDRQTACMAGVLLDRGIDLQAPDPLFALRYAAAWERENAKIGPSMAKLWLRKNVDGRVPAYTPGRDTLPGYVRKLEQLCRAPAGSVETGEDRVRIPWLEGEANEQVSCVYLAALASNLTAKGVRIESAPAPVASTAPERSPD